MDNIVNLFDENDKTLENHLKQSIKTWEKYSVQAANNVLIVVEFADGTTAHSSSTNELGLREIGLLETTKTAILDTLMSE